MLRPDHSNQFRGSHIEYELVAGNNLLSTVETNAPYFPGNRIVKNPEFLVGRMIRYIPCSKVVHLTSMLRYSLRAVSMTYLRL
jgi:hypothetical protein